MKKCLLFANTDWFLYNFCRPLARGLEDAGWEVLLVAPAGPYGEKLASMGFRFRVAPMHRRSLNAVSEARLLLWLWRLLRAERVDVVHGITIKCVVYGGLAGLMAGVARISSVTGLGYVFISDDLKARVLRPIVRALMRVALGGGRSRLILLNRDDEKLFLSERLVSQGRIRFIPGSGVDCARFAPPASAQGERSRILCCLSAACFGTRALPSSSKQREY